MARIAIVDDSLLARHTLAGILRAHRHEPREILPTSLFDVLDALRADTPDLALVDLIMPDCPGMSLVRAVREDPVLGGLPLAVVSSVREEEALRALRKMGIQGYLAKPFEPWEVVNLVNDVLLKRPGGDRRAASAAVLADAEGTWDRLADLLREDGLQVHEVPAGPLFETLAALRQAPPDLVCLPLRLDGCSGLSLLRSLREDPRLRNLPILALAPAADAVDLGLLKALQVDRVAFPPLEPGTLLDQVRVVLDGRVPDPAAFKAPHPAE